MLRVPLFVLDFLVGGEWIVRSRGRSKWPLTHEAFGYVGLHAPLGFREEKKGGLGDMQQYISVE